MTPNITPQKTVSSNQQTPVQFHERKNEKTHQFGPIV